MQSQSGVVSPKALLERVRRFEGAKIMVVGDLIVDEYIWGNVQRISPEAPVPVVHVRDEGLKLGGAANVVNNLRTLGAQVLVCGVAGNDVHGRWLKQAIESAGMPGDGIVIDPSRPTTLKSRVIAHSQQVVRIDREDTSPMSPEKVEAICGYLEKHASGVRGILVSDYAKGVVVEPVMDKIREIARRYELVVTTDPKSSRYEIYRGVTALTPNHKEASQASGIEIRTEEDLKRAGRKLLSELDCRILLITRGEHGMSLFSEGEEDLHIPTVARRVYDVTGAGDTVISVFTLGLCAGASPPEAAHIANIAAGIVVGEVGTATVTTEQIRQVLSGGEDIPKP